MVNCNEANCTCKMVDCVRHGKCCECINHHREKGSLVSCMKAVAEAVKNKVVLYGTTLFSVFCGQRENRSLGMVANGFSIGKLFMMNLMGRV